MKQTRGPCAFCGIELARGGMARHLATFSARRAAIDEATGGSRVTQELYHLQVQDAGGGGYWLHLEMKGSAKLARRGLPVSGVVLADQVKTLDWRERGAAPVCGLPETAVDEVLEKLGTLLAG